MRQVQAYLGATKASVHTAQARAIAADFMVAVLLAWSWRGSCVRVVEANGMCEVGCAQCTDELTWLIYQIFSRVLRETRRKDIIRFSVSIILRHRRLITIDQSKFNITILLRTRLCYWELPTRLIPPPSPNWDECCPTVGVDFRYSGYCQTGIVADGTEHVSRCLKEFQVFQECSHSCIGTQHTTVIIVRHIQDDFREDRIYTTIDTIVLEMRIQIQIFQWLWNNVASYYDCCLHGIRKI